MRTLNFGIFGSVRKSVLKYSGHVIILAALSILLSGFLNSQPGYLSGAKVSKKFGIDTFVSIENCFKQKVVQN